MNKGTTHILRRAALAVVGLLLVAACGSSADGGTEAGATDLSNTTLAELEPVVGETEAPTTTDEAGTPDVQDEPESSETADNGVLVNSRTWEAYTALVDTQRAVQCAAEQHIILNQVELDDGSEIPGWSDASDVSHGEFSAVVARSNSLELLTVTAATGEILVAARQAGAPGASESVEPVATEARMLLDSDGEEIDVGLLFQEMHGSADGRNTELFAQDPGCPVGVATTPLRSAVENFAGDNERFGGRGLEAGMRCRANSLVETIARALAAGEPDEPLVGQLEAAFEIHDTYWGDREPDGGYLSSRDAMLAALGVSSAARATAMAAALEQLTAYRQSMPEGLILCPLDWGWEPS